MRKCVEEEAIQGRIIDAFVILGDPNYVLSRYDDRQKKSFVR